LNQHKVTTASHLSDFSFFKLICFLSSLSSWLSLTSRCCGLSQVIWNWWTFR